MIEFERRFKVDPRFLLENIRPTEIQLIEQGYVCSDESSVVRIRSIQYMLSEYPQLKAWFLTIKQQRDEVGKVNEFEYEITNGAELFNSLKQTITKTRYVIPHGDLFMEVDVFSGRHEGKIIVEVELANDEESQWLSDNLPWFFGEEITGIHEYSNFYMCTH